LFRTHLYGKTPDKLPQFTRNTRELTLHELTLPPIAVDS
jgi:hypothetical protein